MNANHSLPDAIRPDILTEPFLTTLQDAGVVEASLAMCRMPNGFCCEEALGQLSGRRVELVTNFLKDQ